MINELFYFRLSQSSDDAGRTQVSRENQGDTEQFRTLPKFHHRSTQVPRLVSVSSLLTRRIVEENEALGFCHHITLLPRSRETWAHVTERSLSVRLHAVDDSIW